MKIAQSGKLAGTLAGTLARMLAGISVKTAARPPAVVRGLLVVVNRISLSGICQVILLTSALFTTQAWSSDSFDLSQNDGLYTGNADSAALSEVIEKLSQMTDIPMSIAEGQDGPVSFVLEDVSIDELIAGLSSSSMIVRRNVDGQDIIKEVVFMLGSENNDVAAAALPSGQPADAIVVDTDTPTDTAVVQPSGNTETPAGTTKVTTQTEQPSSGETEAEKQ